MDDAENAADAERAEEADTGRAEHADATNTPAGDESERAPDFSRIDDYLAREDLDGYLLDADGDASDQRYLSGFGAPDPFVSLYTPEQIALLVSGLEYGRARAESRANAVRRLSDYGFRSLVADHGRRGARQRAIAAFLDEFGVDSVGAPDDFPLGTADGLRERDVGVHVDPEGVIGSVRATKTPEEIENVRRAQRANESAMDAARALLAEADAVAPEDVDADAALDTDIAGDDPVLVHDGAVLTSERVREEIEVALLRRGCALDETIVACGADAAEPHNRGSGPLRGDQTIVIDIFPRDKETKYHADMTRTFVVGEPTEEARAFYETTRGALDAGLDAVAAGTTGDAVDAAVSQVYEDAGYSTVRSDESAETGFIHGTGHGVGLDVHEAPRLGEGGGGLQAGHVVTVEPGLYDPAVGGVRIEDLVVVTEDGHENLTEYPVEFVV